MEMLDRIRSLVRRRCGETPLDYSRADIGPLQEVVGHRAVEAYLCHCLPPTKPYNASCVGVLHLSGILEEMLAEGASYAPLLPHGYIVIAVGMSGNAVCCHGRTGRVYGADHTSFSEQDAIACPPWGDPGKNWVRLEGCTAENVEQALYPLSDDPLQLVEELLQDKWTDRLVEMGI